MATSVLKTDAKSAARSVNTNVSSAAPCESYPRLVRKAPVTVASELNSLLDKPTVVAAFLP